MTDPVVIRPDPDYFPLALDVTDAMAEVAVHDGSEYVGLGGYLKAMEERLMAAMPKRCLHGWGIVCDQDHRL